ncbi:fungal-specific transcription factor domain-containing protein [Mycena galopus ATCC 62051]|nr:fungal-specific transcription factor domain-containing protein [Mycena galopus ATCC 62051]
MPKGFTPRTRAPYALQACTICRVRKSKCDGVKPVCGSCTAVGREGECSWGDHVPRKPRLGTEAQFEALQKRMDLLEAYVHLLESILAKCVCQDGSSHFQFRPPQSESGQHSDIDSDTDVYDSDEEITKELTVPTQRLKLDDRSGGLLPHGITAPTTISFDNPPPEISRAPVVDNPNAFYVLQLDGVDISQTHPDIDWSRYLPPEVGIDRREHDKILDLSFKFFTAWAFRVVPSLFLRDMYRALRVSRTEQPPRTPHYSPMLHNAVLSVSAVFSTDPYLRDANTRQHFARAARARIFKEVQKPNLSMVLALAFIGTFYADFGDRSQAELFFGMSSRLSLTLGLGLDSTPWVKAGLIAHDEMIGRNWAHWTIFSLDVYWALYFGREFAGPPRRSTPTPFIDSEMDQLPWYHPPAKIPPQPNYLTLIFFENSALLVIARQITDVVNGLHPPAQSGAVQVDEHIAKIDLELNKWKSQLPPQLNITPQTRNTSTPQRLMLHLGFWWCSIILHRPFFNRRTQPTSQIDHVKLCTYAAENILELLETWSSVYTMRLTSLTMLQVIFSAGTIFLLRALQATASPRIAHDTLRTALTQAETCVRYLHEMGRTWGSAMRTGDILRTMLNDRLKPIIGRRLGDSSILPMVRTSPTPLDPPLERRVLPGQPMPAYAPGWNPQVDPAAGWSQPGGVNFFSQMPDAQAVFGIEASYPTPTGQTAFLDTDIDKFFLPDFGCLGAPELWEQGLADSAGADSDDGGNPPRDTIYGSEFQTTNQRPYTSLLRTSYTER